MFLVLWIHLVAAVIWVGGMLFLSIVLVPVFRGEGFSGERRILFRKVALRFRVVVWASIASILATGLFLMNMKVGSFLDPTTWPLMLKLKLLLVSTLFGLTAIHDLWLGPRVGRLMREPVANLLPAEQRLISLSPWVARLGLGLALIILLLAVQVARS